MSKDFAYIRKGISFNPRATAPTDPENGDIYYDTGLLRHRKYENGAWQDLSGAPTLRARLLDAVDLTLPATTATLIDGQTVANGNDVLFAALTSGNNKVYRAAVTGINIVWTAQNEFAGSTSPTKGDSILILEGTTYTLAEMLFDGSNWVAFGGTIGAAEDGTYTDGLFTDFTTSTKVGVAVDRFNEILKAICPQPAPTLSHTSMAQTGTAGRVSFGVSNAISGYSNVTTAAGGSALDINGLFTASGQRRGFFANTANKTGVLADDVLHGDGSPNNAYPAQAFGSADQGSLKLEVNGVVVRTVDLTTYGAGTSTNANGSGFTLTAPTSVSFPGGTLLDVFKYRTGSWVVGTDQTLGYNYVRVSHYFNSTDHWTNYWEWCVDTNATAMSASSPSFNTLAMTGSKQLSGVTYHTGGTAQYGVTIANAYRDCYSDGSAISFTATNGSVPAQALPSMATEADSIVLSGKVFTVSAARILNGSISASVNCTHPTKSTLSGGGSQTISGLLVDIAGSASTDLIEYFDQEGIRLLSTGAAVNNYAAQADIASGTWSSSVSIAGTAGYSDGLLYYNSAVCYPTQGANSGNFGAITNGPANPNYSALGGTRFVYMKFRNSSGSSRSSFKINIAGATATFASGAPSGNALKVEMKFPAGSLSTATGWMNAYDDFATGQWADGNGCRNAGGGLGRALATDWGITVGTKSIAANEYVVIRVSAASAWTGNLSQITLTWQ